MQLRLVWFDIALKPISSMAFALNDLLSTEIKTIQNYLHIAYPIHIYSTTNWQHSIHDLPWIRPLTVAVVAVSEHTTRMFVTTFFSKDVKVKKFAKVEIEVTALKLFNNYLWYSTRNSCILAHFHSFDNLKAWQQNANMPLWKMSKSI